MFHSDGIQRAAKETPEAKDKAAPERNTPRSQWERALPFVMARAKGKLSTNCRHLRWMAPWVRSWWRIDQSQA